MSDERSGYKHDSSDRKLDQAAEAAKESDTAGEARKVSGAGHNPQEIARHNDSGKDRLFEGREQHDDAEKNSEKSRLAKDVSEHHHDAAGDASGAGTDAKS